MGTELDFFINFFINIFIFIIVGVFLQYLYINILYKTELEREVLTFLGRYF